MKRKIILLVFMVVMNLGIDAQDYNNTPFSTPELEAKVDSLMSKMTMDEKIAQSTGTRLRELMVDGKVSLEKCRELIPNGIGHFCQFSTGQALDPEALRDLVREVQSYLMTETRLKIPAIFHEEAITGFATQGATTFPQQIGMGCSWNPELVKRNTQSTAQNMRDAGATFALSPMLDLSRTAHWNRHQESYGEDAYLTSRMGVAFVEGLQGETVFQFSMTEDTERHLWLPKIDATSHGITDEYVLSHAFFDSHDYESIVELGEILRGMIEPGAYIQRNDRKREIASFEEMITWLKNREGYEVGDFGCG